MISIGIITRGKYGLRLVENVHDNPDFRVSSLELPGSLPDFIEDPSEFISGLSIDKAFFSSDLLISYIMHPDIIPEIIHLAGKNGAHAMIIAGSREKTGSKHEILNLSKKYGLHTEIHEICCDIHGSGDKTVAGFAACFGRPHVSITADKGLISAVKVIRCAPCGSTRHMAQGLIGIRTGDAPAKAGLLVQQYPCRAVRGTGGGIHKAAKLHKEAVEKALEEVT